MAHVELRRLSKAFGSLPAVRDLCLEVKPGECLALLGPSGCGKTTTLNLIAGFLDPDAGEICFDGQPITRLPPNRRNAGMVFQSYALFPHLTVAENVAFGLRARGTPAAETGRRVTEALRLVHLTGLEGRHPRALSGGQQQRVALARALVIRPAVLLLDEPFSNLDARLRREMRLEVLEIQKQVGITTLFVTHDQEEALTIADRVAVMNRGAVEQVGRPTEIYERPRTAFVAGFLGESNLFSGRVVGREPRGVVVEAGEGLRLVAGGEAAPGGARATAMVRPEKVRLRPASTQAENSLPVRLTGVTYLGPLRQFHCRAGDRRITALVQAADPALPGEPGTALVAEWSAEDCRLVAGDPEADA